ncbi:MAG: Alpha-galacturonidase [Verrucomicrobiae bacterium]|nr:Alpha-galacturonidase [Verrucomicrobiae bacterium]
MDRKKIVFVGGGSNAWAPNIVKDMLLTEGICDSDFVLLDINKPAAELVVTVLRRLNERFKTGARFTATDRQAAALDGADYVIIAISTGGLDAMALDLAIPEKFGIYHTVGDTSGPGGWARLMRNFEVFRKLAGEINRRAPGAVILNYTNPMTTLTTVLARLCTGPVVGLCHGLFENLEFVKRYYHLEREEDLAVQYAGLNHFFWMTAIHARQRDLLADLKRKIQRHSVTDLLRESAPDPLGFKSARELATELFRETGVMPYLGDRHTCEFFPQYITNRENLRKYRLVRTTIRERRTGFARRDRTLRAIAHGDIPKVYLERSRETAADIIQAHALGRVFIDVGNLPNRGQITNLPLGTVVETAVRVDANGFSPITFGPLPEKVVGWVAPYARVFDLAVAACFQGDRELALHALRLDPVTSHLNGALVRKMGAQLLATHARYIPAGFR